MIQSALIEKYNTSAPRYTSYPTVPYWDNSNFTEAQWKESFIKSYKNQKKLSLYIHLPFCESLCTFCACHKRITLNHQFEVPYIEAVLKEWNLYRNLLREAPLIEEIHLGGGTPSFFSAENLKELIEGILSGSKVSPTAEFSFEGHPNNTSETHLQTLYDLGFRRVSFGVQDYDHTVQVAINRLQPFENVKKVTELARKIGYTSISHDLVFGLPFQNVEQFEKTIRKTLELAPDRLSLYSYAHVPWLKGNGQRGFDENNLPSATTKRQLYELGRAIFEENGYHEIGMDHFALPSDSLFKAGEEGLLNRNFMGYTTTQSKCMLGLGVSAISDSWTALSQNTKSLDEYIHLTKNNIFPLLRGHIQTDEDMLWRNYIQNLMCRFETEFSFDDLDQHQIEQLLALKNDGIILLEDNKVKVTAEGKTFIRNVCTVFDKYISSAGQPLSKTFSKAI
ncbi:oxygen-independent coproporphyrinogen III oxidase [Emticicia sp. 21SJ11W-3]|uniref:oxygen-independent coproporphyrinogen III oxidase n=1 Tax=Emticicia sp. 21SJ11W-3 TaxID=2916755 RepID=UPI0020A1AD2C|nr:oxygen-independent coproporphyrinogen III oxidase [Emticicia sp. 21SJ11W-3]UTA67154.1 oxygen-independent coproporphyrinogen III oxidase [Emticicia sp. 21SJ11W-3]